MIKIREIKLSQLPIKPVSMFLGGLRPAVFKNENGTFGIRILTGESWRGDTQRQEWDYFELDNTGLITASPRGKASLYNKKFRIVDIENAVEEYKDKVIN